MKLLKLIIVDDEPILRRDFTIPMTGIAWASRLWELLKAAKRRSRL